MKYIDADKLLAKIQWLKKKQDITLRERNILIDVEIAIDSLQQEQGEKKTFDDYLKASPAERRKMNMTEILGAEKLAKIKEMMEQEQEQPTCKTCGFYENNCPFIRGKLIPYPNKVCKDYTYSAMKEQEQTEVDLEQEVISYFQGMWPGIDANTTMSFTPPAIMRLVKHFYGLGKEHCWGYKFNEPCPWPAEWSEEEKKAMKEKILKIITKDDNLEEAGAQYVKTYFRDIDWNPDVIKLCLKEAFISGGEYVFKQIKDE